MFRLSMCRNTESTERSMATKHLIPPQTRCDFHRQQEELLAGSRVLYRTVTRSRVRREPSTDAAEVAVVPEGNLVQVMEVVEGGTWYKVGGMGYIFHELLEPASE